MSQSLTALAVVFLVLALGAVSVRLLARKGRKTFEHWLLGSRSFGVLLVWVLMAGEVYTTFSFLGASGWIYSRGAPSYYILAYIVLAAVIGFFLAPDIWQTGRRHGLLTQSDFFQKRFGGKYLGPAVAFIGVLLMIPYLQLQLTGLGIILNITSYGLIGRTQATVAAAVALAVIVWLGGVRTVASMSLWKDLLMLLSAVFIGLEIPHHYFGSIANMFAVLAREHPRHLTMPGPTRNLGHLWYVTTVLTNALGFYMWPHLFGATFTAKSADTLRRNAIATPLYVLTLPLTFFAGFTAFLVMPGLSNGDLSLLTMARNTFPPWVVGVLGGAGVLAALVPGAMLLLTAATAFVKNCWWPLAAHRVDERRLAVGVKIMLFVLAALTAYISLHNPATLVSLLLLGYSGVVQFVPGVVFGLYWSRVTRPGVWCGLILGILCVTLLVAYGKDPLSGVNAGFLGLCANFVSTIAVSLIWPGDDALLLQSVSGKPAQ